MGLAASNRRVKLTRLKNKHCKRFLKHVSLPDIKYIFLIKNIIAVNLWCLTQWYYTLIRFIAVNLWCLTQWYYTLIRFIAVDLWCLTQWYYTLIRFITYEYRKLYTPLTLIHIHCSVNPHTFTDNVMTSQFSVPQTEYTLGGTGKKDSHVYFLFFLVFLHVYFLLKVFWVILLFCQIVLLFEMKLF